MIKRFNLFMFLPVCLMLLACGTTPTVLLKNVASPSELPNVTPIPSELVSITPTIQNSSANLLGESDILSGENCLLFQWQEFIPRETTPEQTLDLLNQNPAIIDVKVYDDEVNGQKFVQEITGHYQTELNSSDPLGFRIIFTGQPSNNVIEVIVIGLDNTIKLEDIVEQCGEPSHIFAFLDYGVDTPTVYWVVRLFWMDKGLIVISGGKESPPLRIDESLPLYDRYSFLEMMPPSEDIIRQRWSDFSPWQGYQDFEYYRVEVE